MPKKAPHLAAGILGFLLLASMTLLLVVLAFVGSLGTSVIPALVLLAALIGLVWAMAAEWPSVFKAAPGWLWAPRNINLFLAVFGGTLVTYYLSAHVGLGAVVAASLVAIIAALVLPAYEVPIYCGAFVGMSCPSVYVSLGSISVAGALGGAVYVIVQMAFNGFGGKLGTIAFISCVLPVVVGGRGFRVPGDPPELALGLQIVACAVVAAVATYVVSIRFKHGAVMGSGIVGMIAGLLLPNLMMANGGLLAVVAICASFAGMSSPERVRNELLLALGGVLTGVIFIYSDPFMGGAGGKLGTIAFASVIAVSGLRSMILLGWTKVRSMRESMCVEEATAPGTPLGSGGDAKDSSTNFDTHQEAPAQVKEW